jgi:hypothetical protein
VIHTTAARSIRAEREPTTPDQATVTAPSRVMPAATRPAERSMTSLWLLDSGPMLPRLPSSLATTAKSGVLAGEPGGVRLCAEGVAQTLVLSGGFNSALLGSFVSS